MEIACFHIVCMQTKATLWILVCIFYCLEYSKPLKGYFIGIEIAEIGFECDLSETLKGRFNSFCLEVEKIISEKIDAAQTLGHFKK